MKHPGVLPAVLVAMCAGAAGCQQYPARAPFLCCVLTCTGSLVKAKKEAPVNDGGRWRCVDGQPIDYNGACAAEEGAECDEQGSESQGGGPVSRAASSGGALTTSRASSRASSQGTSAARSQASSAVQAASSVAVPSSDADSSSTAELSSSQ